MDNILMRFGIPRVLVSDNGPQLVGSEFESYLQERGIKHKKSSVAYPQGNGQVDVTNRILLRGIEQRLRESKNKWPHYPKDGLLLLLSRGVTLEGVEANHSGSIRVQSGVLKHISLSVLTSHIIFQFEDACDAIEGRDGYKFDGQRLRVEFAHGGRGSSTWDLYSSYSRGGVSRRSEYRVLVTGLPSSASWQDLKVSMNAPVS
ncbi:hypothetical protein AgCh_004690 [Apium graveolens]